MTTLLITPNPDRKTAKFKGTIAAGEHVAVTIKDGAEWDEEGLTLRVIDFTTMRTLAVFPRPAEVLEDGEEPDAWETTQSGDLTCTLNLNTVRMVNAARHMIHVPVLFVLGNSDEDSRTLYFRDRYEVELWPERIGDDVPYDLDKWPKQIDEWTDQMEAWARQMQAFDAALTAEAEARASGDAPLSGQVINTNTTNALRQAVKTIGAALGATMRVLAVCAALPLLGATVQTAPLGELDLDQNPSVVTNVDLSGLLTEHQDISGKADKTNTYTKAETDAALGAFAATGAVSRATVYGTPTRWTDATGCVWEVMLNVWVDHAEGNVFRGGTSIFPSEVEGDMRGYLYYDPAAMEYVGGTGGGWYYNGSNSGGTPGAVFAGGPDATSLDNGRFTFGNFTNLVGRVALTNDIPDAVSVVAPSTNATAGTAADAKSTGTALYTGFTEWEFSGVPDGITVDSINYDSLNHEWELVLSDGVMFTNGGSSDTLLVFSSILHYITATRHLVTPTKTSQLVNDGTNGVPFAVETQLVTKQDELPYPTNAIPFAAITGSPTPPSVFYDNDGGSATVSGATLTYQAASNSVGSVALLAGTNVLHITAPSAITGHVRDFGLTVTTEDSATITLDSSVSWRFDAASTNLAAGTWNRVYCTESPTGVFSLQLWTPDSAQEATP